MKILVLTADYPRPDGTHERMYVHVRDRYYRAHGIDVTVINFACNYDYEINGIKVITIDTYNKSIDRYDILVSHASNLRNHYKFLRKHESKFKNIVFFFHGHEILYLNRDYPKPYSYVRGSRIRSLIFQDMYDTVKITLWKKYYKQLASKAQFVFVSKWIKNRFHQNTGLTDKDLPGHCHIINNSIGAAFETASYDYAGKKKFDFITIRSNLDGSTYGVDIVMKLAERNPKSRFLVIGRGKYFDYNRKPENVEWINRTLNHEEMFQYLNDSKCGLMLTRHDTQGVMTCELAAYGMPVITSDIEVCHEFFEEMPNVAMINNNDLDADICKISETLQSALPFGKNKKYFCDSTIVKEIELFKSLSLDDSDKE